MTNRFTPKRIVITFISACLVAFIIYISAMRKSSQNSKNPKDIVTIALDSKISASDPRIIGSDANNQYIENIRFLPLISFDEQGQILYLLVNEIKTLSNKAWNITLKKGIKFNNGKEITAHDVEATYKQILSPPNNFPPVLEKPHLPM